MKLPASTSLCACLCALLVLPGSAFGLAQAESGGDGSGLFGSSGVNEYAFTLEEALRIALENNIDLAIAEEQAESARLSAVGSWGAFDPIFALNLSYANSEQQAVSPLQQDATVTEESLRGFSSFIVPLETGGNVEVSLATLNQETTDVFQGAGEFNVDNLTLAFNQPLLRGAWRRFATADQREARVAHEQRRQDLVERRRRLLLDVTNAYWDLVAANKELEVRDLALRLGNQQLDQNQRRLDVGVGTEVDVLQAETNIATREQERLQAEFNVLAAIDTLRMLIFRKQLGGGPDAVLEGEDVDPWDAPIRPTTDLPTVVGASAVSWRTALGRALGRRTELVRQRLEIEASRVRVDRTKSLRLPQLDLALSVVGTGFDASQSTAFETAAGFDFPTYNASLNFSTPIRNRQAAYAERAARVNLRAARLSYDQIELTVLSEVREAVRGLTFSIKGVEAAQKSSALAQRQLQAEEARYEEGLSTTFQVLEFQRDLAEALSAEVASLGSFAKARAALAHAEGRIDADFYALPTETE